jgi:hypothetical protein
MFRHTGFAKYPLVFLSLGIGAIAALYFCHVRLKPADLPYYRKMVQETVDLHAKSALERSPVELMRKNVRKDIWKDGARVYNRIACDESYITLTQKKEKIKAVEILREIVARIDDGQEIKHLTAASSTCGFPSGDIEMENLVLDCNQIKCAAQKGHLTRESEEIQFSDGVEIQSSGIRAVGDKAIYHQNRLKLFPKPGATCALFHGNDRIDALEIQFDQGKNELLCLSPHGRIEESLTLFDADTGRAQFLANGSQPQTLLLEGNVRIASHLQKKESFAMADSAIYYGNQKKIVLESTPSSRVLFKQEGLEISAPTVHIQDAIQGFGDVRFFFYPEEEHAINAFLMKYL